MAKKTYIIYAEAQGTLMTRIEDAESPEEALRRAEIEKRWTTVSIFAGEILETIIEDEKEGFDSSGVHDLSKWFSQE